MNLSRLLIVLISVLFIAIATGSFFSSVTNTRNYLRLQQKTHAEDTATSLGLAITPLIATGDEAMLNSMVDVVFDRGYYATIKLVSMEGETILERSNTLSLSGVPGWFTHLLPLDVPDAETVITSGWQQMGVLTVSSHPGYAYRKLWDNAGQLFWLSLSIVVIAIGSLIALIHYLLSPLKQIEKQANAISQHRFDKLDTNSFIHEFESVIRSMNRMSHKMETSIAELSEYAEEMRRESYTDPVTDLWSRKGFDVRLTHLLSTENHYGVLAFFRIKEFVAFNQSQGYRAADHLLLRIASLLRIATEPYSNSVVARVRGADFGIILPSSSPEEGEMFAKNLCDELEKLNVKGLGIDVGHLGLATYQDQVDMQSLLAAADNALSRAVSIGGVNGWYLLKTEQDDEPKEIHSQLDWHNIIKTTIDNRDICLYYQEIRSCREDRPLFYECLARVKHLDEKLIPANAFIPMAERLGLIADFDYLALEMVLDHLQKKWDAGEAMPRLAVNVSAHSLGTPGFIEKFIGLLAIHPELAHRVLVEVSEYGAQQNISLTEQFIHGLKTCGSQIGLEHYGICVDVLKHIQKLPVSFIKVDGSFITNIHENKDNQLFLHSMVGIAHGLGVKVIAEWTEKEKDWLMIRKLQFDGAQGFYIGAPKQLD